MYSPLNVLAARSRPPPSTLVFSPFSRTHPHRLSIHTSVPSHARTMPAGILKKTASSRKTAHAAPPPASPSSGSPPEYEFDDSEEVEWAAERQAGPSRPAFQQDDEDMYGDELEEDEDGVAAYESDQGELMEEDDNPEVRLQLQSRPSGLCTD